MVNIDNSTRDSLYICSEFKNKILFWEILFAILAECIYRVFCILFIKLVVLLPFMYIKCQICQFLSLVLDLLYTICTITIPRTKDSGCAEN